MDKSENKMNPKKSIKRDFHAKPLELVIQGRDFRYYKVEDVLREREACEKEIALYKTAMNANAKSAEAAEAELRKLQDTTVPHEEYQAVLGRADRAEARAEAAEADVKTLLEQNKVLAEAAEKGGTVFVPVYHQLRLKEAEARIVELENKLTLIQEERVGYEARNSFTLNPNEASLLAVISKVLAGEKIGNRT